MAMVIATTGFAAGTSAYKADKIAEIKNFYLYNQGYSLQDRVLEDIPDDKLENLYQGVLNIEKNGFNSVYKEDQINTAANLLKKASLSPDARELLMQHGMIHSSSQGENK